MANQSEKARRLPVTDPLFKASTSYLKHSRLTHYSHCGQGASDTVLASIHLAPERFNKNDKPILLSKCPRGAFNADIRNREPIYLYFTIALWTYRSLQK